jgi:hypothetical protein
MVTGGWQVEIPWSRLDRAEQAGTQLAAAFR